MVEVKILLIKSLLDIKVQFLLYQNREKIDCLLYLVFMLKR